MGLDTTPMAADDHDLVRLVGKPVTEFLAKLCAMQPAVQGVCFAAYAPEPKLGDRLHNMLTPEEADLRDQATATCRGNGIPFWDALLGICMRRDSIPERFLESAGIHNSEGPAFQCELPSNAVSTQRIKAIIAGLPGGLGLVVSSKVLLRSGDTAHIPMLDFRCPYSAGNVQVVCKILKLLGESCGILVASGRSYHYYGVRLLSPLAFTKFMARALLFAPVVDPRYIAHRLADGECRLKLVASKESSITEIAHAYTNCA